MKTDPRSLASLTDEQLLLKVRALAALEREATAQLIASLAKLDARRLYLAEGFSSLFSDCTETLDLSEHAAYNRIEVARAARKWPLILQMIADGAITLTVVRLLVPSLTDDNHRQLLDAAMHRSKREVEQMISNGRSWPRRGVQGRRAPQLPAHATCLPPSGARFGSAMRGSARSSERRDGAPSAAFSSSTISSPLLTAVRPLRRTFNFVAGRTTCMR